MSQYKTLKTKLSDSVLTITLNRPEVLNALSTPLMEELIDAIDAAGINENARVIVITGSEKAFAAGADIAEMKDKTFSDMQASNIYGRLQTAFANCHKPVIAAVSGYALGGGCELVMMCDFVLASDTAKFGQPEVKLGTLPGIGGSQRLTKLIGRSKAMEMCMTGRFMDAIEAERAGLVARILPADGFLDSVAKIAFEIAGYSLSALGLIKQAVHYAENAPLEQGLAYERGLFYASFSTADQKEGMAAFLEKRDPAFTDK